MSREITTHKVNPANDVITIAVVDQPGVGGANHHYVVQWPNDPQRRRAGGLVELYFQNGPIGEAGVNGITHEALLAIVEDRLKSFQAGKFACAENGRALAFIHAAQEELQSRTRARMGRGVEGTHQI